MKRILTVLLVALVAGIGCSRERTLTAERAKRIILGQTFEVEPAYAEVPMTVTWSEQSPKDEFDELSLETLANLEREGYVTVERETAPDGSGKWTAEVTRKGFPILGDVPSARGPAFRAQIAVRHIDGVRNFVPHPDDPTVGRAELVWHYEKPTPLYDLFETKIDKPLDTQFVSVVSIHWEDGAWRTRTLVGKERAEPPKGP